MERAAARLAIVGFIALLVSPLVTWWGFGYDAFRRPWVAAAAALVVTAGALRALRRESSPHPGPAWMLAGAGFLAAHLLSGAAAQNRGEWLLALTPVAAGMAVFWGLARGWVPRAFVEQGALSIVAAVAIVFSATGIGQRIFDLPAVSTMGNTNYAGAMAAILGATCLGGALCGGSPARRVACAVGALVTAVHLVFTDSRGGMLGLAAGVVAIAIVLARRRQWIAVAACAAVLIVPPVVKFRRVASSFDPEDDTRRVRIGLWKGTARLATDCPVAGCGAGNFRYRFPAYRDPLEFEISSSGVPGWGFKEAEDPHSTPLLILSTTGPVGLAAFVGLLVLGATAAFGAGSGGSPVPTAALGGLAAFAVAGLFNSLHEFSAFDVLSGALLGMLAMDCGRERPPLRFEPALRGAGAVALALLTVPAITAAAAERCTWGATHEPRDPVERVRLLQQAVRWRDGQWAAHFELGNVHMRVGDHPGAIREFSRVLEIHPDHVPAFNSLAGCCAQGGDAERAAALLRRAEALLPNYWLTQYNLAGVASRTGDRAEERRRLLRTVELNPDHAQSYYFLGIICLKDGQREQGRDWLRKAKEAGAPVAQVLPSDMPGLRTDPFFAEFFAEEKK